MEKGLVHSDPLRDALALSVLIWAVARFLFSVQLDPVVKLVACGAILVVAYRLSSEPTAQAESKGNSRKTATKHKPPIVWSFVARVWLFLHGEAFSLKSNHSHSQPTSEAPAVIRYVGKTHIGLSMPTPTSTRFIVSGVEWTQVYRNDEQELAVLFGLTESTVYEVVAIRAGLARGVEYVVCTESRLPSVAAKPRKADDATVRGEAIDSAKAVLADEKAYFRKLRRDGVKRLAAVRNEIEALSVKITTKRRGDERTRKRAVALRERVNMLSEEFEHLSDATSIAGVEVTKMASQSQQLKLEHQSWQQDLDVAVRVWAELQRSKESEIQKLTQRCVKLQERIAKLELDLRSREHAKSTAIHVYIDQLRDQRNARKQRRARLESDFRVAIAKLEGS